jgi:uncharacterized cupredoxin-like copper-binding protein
MTRRFPLIALSAAILGASALGVTAMASPSQSSSATSAVGVTLGAPKEFSMVLSPAKAKAGTVTFKVTNKGKIVHEAVVVRTSVKASALRTSGGRASEKGSIGEVADLAPGKSGAVTLKLKAGHYALICNIPGHYQGGMRADFTVK